MSRSDGDEEKDLSSDDEPLSSWQVGGDEDDDDDDLAFAPQQPTSRNVGGYAIPEPDLPIIATLSVSTGDQHSSENGDEVRRTTPLRMRPRSNPRTRTPMRHESPLASFAPGSGGGGSGSRPSSRGTPGDRSASGQRPRSASLASLFEANAEQGADGDADTDAPVRAPAPAGHWLARSSQRRTSDDVQNRRRGRGRPVGPSDKQRPSQRKLRRWDNDRFVGVASQLNRKSAEAFWYGEMDRDEFLMPNHPMEYRSAFARLAVDDTANGASTRDRFVKGEAATPSSPSTPSSLPPSASNYERAEHAISSRMEKLGLNTNGPTGLGDLLVDKIAPRIRAVVSRLCIARAHRQGTSSTPVVSFSTKILDAFESYLVSMAGGSSLVDEGDVMGVLEKVLIRLPTVSKKQFLISDEGKEDTKFRGMFIPPIQFHFPDGDDSQRKSGAFHRILLHAICQFHGLEASSLTQSNSRIVTIQGGVFLAPTLRLQDYIV